MRYRNASLIALGVVALCLASLAASPPQRRATSRQPSVLDAVIPKDAKPGMAPRMSAMDITAPAWDVTVDWSLQLTAQNAAIYQQMASAIAGVNSIPADRTNYYSMVVNQPGFTVNGWTGMVNDVAADGNSGNFVTVAVFPLLTSDQFGYPTQIASDYSERYNVAGDGTITYLGFLDPQGLAGQPAAMVR